MAYPAAEVDAPPSTSAAEEAAGCSPVGIRRTVAVVPAVEADDPSVDQE